MISKNKQQCPNCWGYQEYDSNEVIQGFECEKQKINHLKY
jgi:hypothetical protein